MGVSGSGKTTLGKAPAQKPGWDFFDADDYHPPENIAKMTAGIPLSDSDRTPWLAALHHQLLSTLKEAYRVKLLEGMDEITVIYLKGSYDLILSRMSTREDHYMKPGMLQSQFDALEEPKDAIVLDVKMPLKDMIDTITKKFEEGY